MHDIVKQIRDAARPFRSLLELEVLLDSAASQYQAAQEAIARLDAVKAEEVDLAARNAEAVMRLRDCEERAAAVIAEAQARAKGIEIDAVAEADRVVAAANRAAADVRVAAAGRVAVAEEQVRELKEEAKAVEAQLAAVQAKLAEAHAVITKAEAIRAAMGA